MKIPSFEFYVSAGMALQAAKALKSSFVSVTKDISDQVQCIELFLIEVAKAAYDENEDEHDDS